MGNVEVHAEDKLNYYIRMDLSTFEELFSWLSEWSDLSKDTSVMSVLFVCPFIRQMEYDINDDDNDYFYGLQMDQTLLVCVINVQNCSLSHIRWVVRVL